MVSQKRLYRIQVFRFQDSVARQHKSLVDRDDANDHPMEAIKINRET